MSKSSPTFPQNLIRPHSVTAHSMHRCIIGKSSNTSRLQSLPILSMLGSNLGHHHCHQQLKVALLSLETYAYPPEHEALPNLSFMPPYAGDQYQGRAAAKK